MKTKGLILSGVALAVLLGVGVIGTVNTAGKTAGSAGAAPKTGTKIKVLFLRGGGHDINNPLILKKDALDKTNDFKVTLSTDLDDLKENKIRQFDIIAVYTTGRALNKEQEDGLCNFVKNGGGFVGIHCATDSFKKSDRYWEMVGGRFAGHGHAKYTVYIYDKDHPITEGMKDFEIQDESYRHNYHRNAQMRSLTRMNRGNERQSMAWVSHYGKGRVFYTGNGHDHNAWSNPHFQKLVVRGMYWAARWKPKDPPAK